MSYPAHAFKPGDRVKTKSGYSGIIRSASGYYSDGSPIYYVDFDHNWIGGDLMKEHELYLEQEHQPFVASPSHIKKCECGAAHTSFPDQHSHWCVLHVGN